MAHLRGAGDSLAPDFLFFIGPDDGAALVRCQMLAKRMPAHAFSGSFEAVLDIDQHMVGENG